MLKWAQLHSTIFNSHVWVCTATLRYKPIELELEIITSLYVAPVRNRTITLNHQAVPSL
ncbi:hypothetical protein NIES2104_61250 [Leptolyngbya sp. NIES-2104]|nr:hypothetical protein NIES2104_61250 [Leptolyngbya sp. NIES-2104]